MIEDVGEEILEEARFQNIPVGSSIGRSSMENLQDLHFLEEKKEELEERLRLSVELEEKWRRQYFVKAAQCELEETRFLVFDEIVRIFCSLFSNYSTLTLILFEGE